MNVINYIILSSVLALNHIALAYLTLRHCKPGNHITTYPLSNIGVVIKISMARLLMTMFYSDKSFIVFV